ncbi:hypothetical protein, partial [Escherichia coli]|uniref:hypothetical protein n=1 Tax=Escherichia coli TaxID=562 RepID=UPI001954F5EC
LGRLAMPSWLLPIFMGFSKVQALPKGGRCRGVSSCIGFARRFLSQKYRVFPVRSAPPWRIAHSHSSTRRSPTARPLARRPFSNLTLTS